MKGFVAAWSCVICTQVWAAVGEPTWSLFWWAAAAFCYWIWQDA